MVNTFLTFVSSRKFAGLDNEHPQQSIYGGAEHSADFSIDFPFDVDLKGVEHEIALIRADLWNTFTNIDGPFYNNDKFKYFSPVQEDWVTVTIPRGNYSFRQLSTFITETLRQNEETFIGEKGDIPPFEIVPDYPVFKVKIEINDEDYSVDLTEGNFHKLLGFDAKVVDDSEYGAYNGNIHNDVDSIFIRLKGVRSYVNGDTSDMIYCFTPTVPVGAAINLEPHNPVYVPFLNQYNIRDMHVYLTDQLNRKINLNNEGTVFCFHIRPRTLK